MIRIALQNIQQSYKGEEIFTPVSFDFEAGSNSVILGRNGSGKSTLLKIISSFMEPSEGSIQYFLGENELTIEQLPFYTSLCSPSAVLEEKLSLSETFDFHYALRDLKPGISKADFFSSCFLSNSINKRVKELSSGMTQRLKLAFAFMTDSHLILLDEPCMNLDAQGIDLYVNYVEDFGKEATQIVASNSVGVEFAHCNAKLTLNK